MTAGPTSAARASGQASPVAPSASESLFVGLLGLLLGVGLLKFGNPVILDHLVDWPRSVDEWRAFAWPVCVGQLGLLLALVAGLVCIGGRFRTPAPRWLLACGAAWLVWQGVATVGSIDPPMTRVVLLHFICCGTFWLLGHFALSPAKETRVFWLCLTLGFVGVLGMAMDQHFGGLEATRKMILERPDAARLPADALARIQSNRVFSTLVYPNALAGCILLLLPPTAILAWRFGSRWGAVGSRCWGGGLVVVGLAVLVWSGSKAGWLIAMATTLVILFHLNWARGWKWGLGILFVAGGLVGFGALYGQRLSRGATSVVARFDYWQAGVHGARQRPWVGNGPGAFKKIYASVKRPESEMAQLAHNDFLQQATDSGIAGFLTYSGFVLGALAWLYRQRARISDPLRIAVWLGLAAWFGQGMVEFGLYIPATAWTAFTLLGWLTAQPNIQDSSGRRASAI